MTTTTSILIRVAVVLSLAGAEAAIAQTVTAPIRPTAPTLPQHLAPNDPLIAVVLVKANGDGAVVRTGDGSLHKARVNDLVGVAKAVVREVSYGRLVLEEAFLGSDGKPNRALIVIKEGERGGSRFMLRSDTPALAGTKPSVVAKQPETAKPASKKPPQM